VIGRNVRIGSEVNEGLFQGRQVPSGAVIQAPGVEGH
jgi:hypothetical protein